MYVRNPWSADMAERYRSIPPALKHGAFSGMGLLPGEDASAFKKLRSDVVAEYLPVGRHEEYLVDTIARLLWRKQNLEIYRLANEARRRHLEIRAELAPKSGLLTLDDLRDPDDVRRAEKLADEKARKELEWAWKLVESGDLLTIECLERELALVERIERMIVQSLKQLLYVRGLKSLSSPSSTPALPQLVSNSG